MVYKNSYIFLKRNEKEKVVPKKDNTIIIKLSPSFKSLLEKTFDNIKFDCEDSEDINSGRIVLKKNNKEVEVQFKYYSVKGNYYLDVMIDTKNVTSAVSIFNEINDILDEKILLENDFKESYTSYIEKLINIQNENLSSSKKRGAKSIPEKPSISQRIKLKNLLESSGYTLSIPLEYLNSFDVDCIIKYITTQSIDLGDERIYNYVHKSNLN